MEYYYCGISETQTFKTRIPYKTEINILVQIYVPYFYFKNSKLGVTVLSSAFLVIKFDCILKVLRSWGQKQLANNLNEAGRRLLNLETEEPTKETKKKEKEPTELTDKGALSGGENSGDDKTEASDSMPLHSLKKKRAKRTGQTASKEDAEGPVNEELKALEAHMLSLSKQG